jgi:hypothetical protein
MSFRKTLLPVLALIAASAAAAVGCGGLGVSSSSVLGDGTTNGATPLEDAGAGGPFAAPSADAGTSTKPVDGFKSNPLCAALTSGTCDPQRTNVADAGPTTTADCIGLLKIDAGAPDAHGNDGGAPPPPPSTQYACHVAHNPSGPGVAPVCVPEGTTVGTCTESAQCHAGYECTGDGANLDAQCRRYCCEVDACDLKSFCDVQPIVASSGIMVPVCMPLAACDLLSQSTYQCPGQQCGIALDAKGLELKTCLDIGPRGVGDDCETDHCAKDLACLGVPGARKCFQLCDTTKGATGYGCPMGETCRASGTTFKGGSVGICGL